jgi:putative flippase GtrA
MTELFHRIRGIRFARYIAASGVALGADMAAFLVLLDLGVLAAAASAAGYCLGILVHWLVSSRKVFGDTLAAFGRARTKQKALFVISALMGLGLTTIIVGAADLGGIDPRVAKLVAIAASFAMTWVLRSRVVFRDVARA